GGRNAGDGRRHPDALAGGRARSADGAVRARLPVRRLVVGRPARTAAATLAAPGAGPARLRPEPAGAGRGAAHDGALRGRPRPVARAPRHRAGDAVLALDGRVRRVPVLAPAPRARGGAGPGEDPRGPGPTRG